MNKVRLGVVLTLVLVLAVSVFFAPSKYFEVPHVTIDATIHEDGTLDVRETRRFDFHGSFTSAWWTFGEASTRLHN